MLADLLRRLRTAFSGIPRPGSREFHHRFGLGALVFLTVIALARDGQDGVGIRELEQRVSAELRRDQLPVEPLTDPIRIRAFDMVWASPQAEPFLSADSLVATVLPARLLAGDVVASHLALYSPTLLLARSPGATQWNYQMAIDRLLGPQRDTTPSTGRGRLVLIEDAAIIGGVIGVQPPTGEAFEIRDLRAELPRIAISGLYPEPVAELTHLSATFVLDRDRPALPIALDDALLRLTSGGLDFDIVRIRVASSLFTNAEGSVDFGAPGLGLDARVHAARVELTDLHGLLPDLPPSGTASFDLVIDTDAGGRSALEFTALDLMADGSHIEGSFGLAFGGGAALAPLAFDLRLEPLTTTLVERFVGPLPNSGTISGRIHGPPTRIALDLTARLTAPGVAEPFNAGLVGVAAFSGAGFRLAYLNLDLRRIPLAAFRPFIPGLSLDGVVSGHVVLEGAPGQVPMNLDLRLEVAAGTMTLAGTLDFSRPVPSYDLRGRLIDIRLDDLLQPSVPPALLTARFSLLGTGIRLETASARLDLVGFFTGWQSGPADSISVHAALGRGTLELDEFEFRLATLDLSATGTWNFEPPGAGEISYRLALSSLAPFAPYLPGTGAEGVSAGSLLVDGILAGTISRPRLTGSLIGSRLAYDSWRADTLAATYDLIGELPLTEARVHLKAEGIATPIGPYTNTLLDLAVADSTISIDLRAQGAQGRGPLVVVGTGRIEQDGLRSLQIDRLTFDLDGETWSLERPARLAFGADPGIAVEDLLLRQIDGPGLLSIQGTYPPADDSELQIEIVDLPVAEILVIAGYAPLITGRLSLELRIHGPPTVAEAGGTFALRDGSYQGQAIPLLEGTLLVDDRRLAAVVTAELDTAGTVLATAELPLVLDLTGIPDIAIPRDEPMRVTAEIDSLALRLLALTTPELRDVEGTLHGSIELTGTPARPLLAGNAQIYNGAMTIIPLDIRYDQISGEFALTGQNLEVENLVAHSGGWAVVMGTITFADPSNPGLDLAATFDGFRAIGAENLEPAAVDGAVTLGGTFYTPVLAGAITVDRGNLSLAIFQSPATVEEPELAAPLFAMTPLDAGAAPTEPAPDTVIPLFERLQIADLTITAGPNFWVVADQFRAQLEGELILQKEDGLEIFGSLEGDRGIFTLRVGPLVRRFTLVQTSVRFFGTTELDPALDVTASRLIPGPDGQVTEVLIHITGTLDQPEVDITTSTGASVPESELLSFLLFGRPGFAAPGQAPLSGPILEEAVFGIGSLAELASIGLEEALVAELGLPIDYFLIQPSQGPFGGLGAPTIVLGQEIAPNLFLTINTGFGGLFGAGSATANAWSISLQWRISREWTLELAVEPVNPARFFRGLGTALPIVGTERQLIVELQRRWTY